MGSRQTYRVSAYNTSKQSENKIHDDTVARRFGFSGGLVPGVDVMAYMMHLPVEKWGRAFLERGLIEARFVKPVYDGEIAELAGEESNGVLSIEVHSRGDLCATGSASLPASAPSMSLADFEAVAAVAERKPVDANSYEVGNWLGAVPRTWAGDAATEYRSDIRETDTIYAREGLGHPGLLPRVMNRVLVDNAVLGPWIHVERGCNCSPQPGSATNSRRVRKSPAITTRRAIASSNSTRWWLPTATPRWRIASTLRSTSQESRRRRNTKPRTYFQSSCPALCRASTSFFADQDVDGRDKPGHDVERFAPAR